MPGRLVSTLLLAALFALICALSLWTGSADLSFGEIFSVIFGFSENETAKVLLFQIRLPRLAAAVLVGASLASAGLAMQTLFRNPLADPSITGVSSGAALGAALAICLLPNFAFLVQPSAIIFGLLASFLIWHLGRLNGRTSTFSMLLAGIAVNAFCGAIVGFAMYSARDAGLKSFIFWTLGSLDSCSWLAIACVAFVNAAAWLLLLFNARALNMLSLGIDAAFHGGANVERLQFIAIFCSAIMTGAAVSICGIIGFVGLVVPHVMRILFGCDNRVLLPLSALAGAILLIVADLISRIVTPLDNVPIGVVTALIGAPFFIYLLGRVRND